MLSAMKKFLEVLMDDDGTMHIKAEDPVPDPREPDVEKKYDQMHKAAIKAMTENIWKKHDLRASMAIRVLSMADMACDCQPYEHLNHFFFMMLESFLPHYENYCNKLKAPYGFKAKEMVKPFTCDGATIMKLAGDPFQNDLSVN